MEPEIKVIDERVPPVMACISIEINGIVMFKFDQPMDMKKEYLDIGYEEMRDILSLSIIPGLD
jgi:hypothetical protein